jgi:hypothetical protein
MKTVPGVGRALLLYVPGLIPGEAGAHSFGTPYVLPLPLWMYAYGCAATLIITFSLLGFFATSQDSGSRVPGSAANRLVGRVNRRGLAVLRAGAGAFLLLTIVAGFIGGTNPAQNIGMTLFWVVFVLAFAYATMLVGNLYTIINPWKCTIGGLEGLGVDLTTRRVRVQETFSCWPAFVFYVGLIWIELFLAPEPLLLSLSLVTYSVITVIGAALYGKDVWFNNFDLFERYFSLIGKMAPIEYKRANDNSTWCIFLRPPCTGHLRDHPKHISTVLFVLFMLCSTTYDAIHETVWWVSLFWTNLLSILQPIWGTDLGKAQSLLIGWYEAYQQAGLVVFPFFYLALYSAALLWTKVLTGTHMSVRTLTLKFIYSLIPIAIAYNFTHYFTMLVVQLGNFPAVLSDPFDRGWNLIGLRDSASQPILPMGFIWHLQVGVLLAGHVVGVFIAHREASRIFSTRRQVILSQVPILLLMVLYTVFGLWILALPLGPIRG